MMVLRESVDCLCDAENKLITVTIPIVKRNPDKRTSAIVKPRSKCGMCVVIIYGQVLFEPFSVIRPAAERQT